LSFLLYRRPGPALKCFGAFSAISGPLPTKGDNNLCPLRTFITILALLDVMKVPYLHKIMF